MRILFFGSAPFACPSLDILLKKGYNVVGVISQPDRPKGRDLKINSCAVKVCALNYAIPVYTPHDINSSEDIDTIVSLNPDLIIVAAYGQILRSEILVLPKKGCVNVHASLLPEYRGAAPIQWAIAAGEHATGVTTIFMSERMDAGDIILQKEVVISPGDTAASLHDKLAVEGAGLLLRTVESIKKGGVNSFPQDELKATFAPKLRKQDGRIDWTKNAEEIYNKIRGFNPWPCCFCMLQGKRGSVLRVLEGRVEEVDGEEGRILDVTGEGPIIGTGYKAIRLLKVQPEGRKIMSGASYLCGYGLKKGDLLK